MTIPYNESVIKQPNNDSLRIVITLQDLLHYTKHDLTTSNKKRYQSSKAHSQSIIITIQSIKTDFGVAFH